MKGLLLKDLYMAAKYCRVYPIIVLVFAAASIFSDGNIFFLFYPILMAGIIPVTLMSYDEKSRWEVYSGAFPYTRKQLVTVKYGVALLVLGCSVALIAAVQGIHLVFSAKADWLGYALLLAVMLPLGLFPPCILLPVMFRFGVDKGRIVFYAVIIVVCGALGALGALDLGTGAAAFLSGLGSGWTIAAVLAAGALLFLGSWRLSIHFYQKREL